MKGYEKYLFQFLQGSDQNFIIPIYQRNYDWKQEQCKQLFDDLENLLNKKLSTHFFGSVVIKADSLKEIIIIDGQQRITTISLILLALCNYYKNNNNKPSQLIEKITEQYLINKWADNDKKIKLKPIKKDKEAFERLYDNNEESFIETSHLTQNYRYFYNRISESKFNVEELYEAIEKLQVVIIELQNDDNPQLVFESMNSTGLDLSEADKIRNYILMDKPYNIQKEYYEKYWNRIEENVNYDTTNFIKDYLTIKMNKIPTFSKIYRIFKEDFITSQKLDIEETLKDMLIYSNCYSKILNLNIENKEINYLIQDIVYLKYTLLYPFITQVLKRYEAQELSSETVINILKILINYVIRRIVCNKPTNALPKYFCTMDKEIINKINKQNLSISMYDDVFSYFILNKKGYVENTTDEEFKEAFTKFKLYKLQSNVKNYILRELENYNNKEKIKISSIDEKVLSIEHIMPQTLSPVWEKALGDNFSTIYEKYVDTIGNLTLTAYNSELQNKPYIEKKTMDGGYLASKLYLSSTLEKYDTWGENEILDRAEILSNRALTVWNNPTTNYKDSENTNQIFSLADEDISYINTRIKSFKLSDSQYDVSSWRDFLYKIASFLYGLDKMPMLKLFDNYSTDTDFIKRKISTQEKDLRSPIKLDDNLYIESNYNADSIVYFARIIVETYELDLDEVEIILKDNL